MNTNIIARWRDAITDPPVDGIERTLRLDMSSGSRGHKRYKLKIAAFGETWSDENDEEVDVYEGDQWLDVTAIPAVAVAKVQAAVKRIKDCQEMSRGNNEYVAFGTAVDVIEEYTGITPSEVQP